MGTWDDILVTGEKEQKAPPSTWQDAMDDDKEETSAAQAFGMGFADMYSPVAPSDVAGTVSGAKGGITATAEEMRKDAPIDPNAVYDEFGMRLGGDTSMRVVGAFNKGQKAYEETEKKALEEHEGAFRGGQGTAFLMPGVGGVINRVDSVAGPAINKVIKRDVKKSAQDYVDKKASERARKTLSELPGDQAYKGLQKQSRRNSIGKSIALQVGAGAIDAATGYALNDVFDLAGYPLASTLAGMRTAHKFLKVANGGKPLSKEAKGWLERQASQITKEKGLSWKAIEAMADLVPDAVSKTVLKVAREAQKEEEEKARKQRSEQPAGVDRAPEPRSSSWQDLLEVSE